MTEPALNATCRPALRPFLASVQAHAVRLEAWVATSMPVQPV